MRKARILFRVILILLTDIKLVISLLRNLFFFLFRRIKLQFTKRKLIIIALTEQLGDIVAAEPVAAFLKAKFPGCFLCWAVDKKYAALTMHNPAINKTITVSCLSEWIILKYFLPSKNIYDLHINNKECSRHHLVNAKENPNDITVENYFTKGNLLYAFSRSAGLEMPDNIPPYLHIPMDTANSIHGKYIVFHTSANNSDKMWGNECWNKLAVFILEHFSDFFIAEIGFEKKITGENKQLIDMTGEKNLSFITGLIRDSSLFIGIDSGFAHFANALNKDAIILIGTLDTFKNYMPYSGKFQKERNNVIHYHSGPLNTMPCNSIFDVVNTKLSGNIHD